MNEQGKNALEGLLHNHGGEIHVEYGCQHHYVIAKVSRHEVINELQAILLAGQIVLSWNEHNTLLRLRDELVQALRRILKLTKCYHTVDEHEQGKTFLNHMARINDISEAMLAKQQENQ